MIQKLLKVGSSTAVVIPKRSLEELGLQAGDEVRVEVDEKERLVMIRALTKKREEIIAWTDAFIHRYRAALEALAKK